MKGTWTFGLALLFISIQLLSLFLFLIGIVVVGVLCIFKVWVSSTDGEYHFPTEFWIWDNQEDGICATWYHTPIDRWLRGADPATCRHRKRLEGGEQRPRGTG